MYFIVVKFAAKLSAWRVEGGLRGVRGAGGKWGVAPARVEWGCVRRARRGAAGRGWEGCLVEAEAEQAARDPVVVDLLGVHDVLRASDANGGVFSQSYAACRRCRTTAGWEARGAQRTDAERATVRCMVRCGACLQLLLLGAMLALPSS